MEEQDIQDISKLSPSEIEELQRKNCVFCHIASGKVPARKVYEDNECLAVLDINPANPGHTLLMPKEHYTVMLQVPEQLIGHVFVVAKGLSQASLQALQGKGTTIFAANGTAAGQRAPHFMLHIIPRMAGDNIGMYIPSRALPGKEAAQVAAALSAALGGKKVTATATAQSIGGGSEEKASGKNRMVVEAEIAKEEKRGEEDEGEDKKEHEGKGHEEDGRENGKDNLDSITEFLAKGSARGAKGSEGGRR